jgi:hypothetical protein
VAVRAVAVTAAVVQAVEGALEEEGWALGLAGWTAVGLEVAPLVGRAAVTGSEAGSEADSVVVVGGGLVEGQAATWAVPAEVARRVAEVAGEAR